MKKISISILVLLFALTCSGIAFARPRPNPPLPAKIPVLLYHQILTDTDTRLLAFGPGETIIHINVFKQQMQWLKDNGYTTLRLADLEAVVDGRKTVPQKSVVIAFDDGWSSQLLILPTLRQHRFHAIFAVLIAPEWVDGPYMSFADFVQIDQSFVGHDIIGHTVSHPDVLQLWTAGNLTEVNFQLQDPRTVLQAVLAHPIFSMAWPYGEYNQQLIGIAQEIGYDSLFTVNPGFNTQGTSPLEFHRSTIDGSCGINIFIQTVQTGAEIFCGP